ncbi:hypothetical protein P689_122294 [Candidatus Riesia pediculischaeffi PTSU]|uniref:Uncharacterized protein n=1 Tax=Candidatus Riesia pediculischaeffi PTSU TaxID=1401651 RepID=A0A0C1RZU5_9ENTR|nr:hypothetical protein P689_122294 [Candidatus Riesia pediculischaeffi PTSU]
MIFSMFYRKGKYHVDKFLESSLTSQKRMKLRNGPLRYEDILHIEDGRTLTR